jgi:hypothetical protein
MDDAIRRNARYVQFNHMRAVSTQQRMSIFEYLSDFLEELVV